MSLFRDAAPPETRSLWAEQARHCAGFVQGDAHAAAGAAETQGLNLEGVTHYTAYDAYTLDPPLFLPHLRRRLEGDGVVFSTLARPLDSLEQAANEAERVQRGRGPCAAVVNCAGLAGAALSGEPAAAMGPVRGDIALLQSASFAAEGRQAAMDAFGGPSATGDEAAGAVAGAKGTKQGRPCADRAVNDEQNSRGLAYVIPRRNGTFVVGGTSRPVAAATLEHAQATPAEDQALCDSLVEVRLGRWRREECWQRGAASAISVSTPLTPTTAFPGGADLHADARGAYRREAGIGAAAGAHRRHARRARPHTAQGGQGPHPQLR